MSMERVTLRIPAKQVGDLDDHVDDGRYPSRSEAIRTAVRNHLDELPDTGPSGEMWSKGAD